MSVTAEETFNASGEIGTVGYRRLTESQGARSWLYEVTTRGTADQLQSIGLAKKLPPLPERAKKIARANVAQREHVARLLRTCQSVTALLKHTQDYGEALMLGARLCELLEQLWEHRLVREDDWIETLNLLQIVLRNEVFESMSESKKNALTQLFREKLTPRTVGSLELRGAVKLLKDAGFDVWRGVGVASDNSDHAPIQRLR